MSGVHVEAQRRNEPGPEGPASSVLPPATALGLLLSRALSSERARPPYGMPRALHSPKARPHPDARKALNLGGLGAAPPEICLGSCIRWSSGRNMRRPPPSTLP